MCNVNKWHRGVLWRKWCVICVDPMFFTIEFTLSLSPFVSADYGACGVGSNKDVGDGSGEMGDNLVAVNFGSDFVPVQFGGGGFALCAINGDGQAKWYDFMLFVCFSDGCFPMVLCAF